MKTEFPTRACVTCGATLPPDSRAELCPNCQLWHEIKSYHGTPIVGREVKAGDVLGDYHLVEKLGQGGMGVVFKARDETLSRDVAVKILPRNIASDAEFSARFLREARAVANLNHPNIIQIYYIGQQEEVLFFAMEFVEGRDLNSLLDERKQLPDREAVEFARQAALGLQHAQRHGVIHRDLKPANLMLTRDSVIKIADFGLAKKLSSETTESLRLTSTQEIMGTPSYMSPEQAKGEPVDHRADIYSLGATLYHFLAGRPPFVGHTAMTTLMQQLNDAPPPIQQFNPSVSPPLARVLEKMLAKDPTARPQSYDELLHDLAGHSMWSAAVPRFVAEEAAPAARSSRRAFGFAAAILVVLLGIFFWPRPQESPKPPEPKPRNQPDREDQTKSSVGEKLVETPQDAATGQTTALTPQHTAPAKGFASLDLAAAFNASIIRSERDRGMNFEPQFQLNWGMTSWLKAKGASEAGWPDDGRVAIPDTNPIAYFQVRMTPDRNSILITDQLGRFEGRNPATVTLADKERGKYARLAFLTAACWGDGIFAVALHYESGGDEVKPLQILDWNPGTRRLAPANNQRLAIATRARRADGSVAHVAEMFSQTIACDPQRTLVSLSASLSRRENPQGLGNWQENFPRNFTAAIFAISAQLADGK